MRSSKHASEVIKILFISEAPSSDEKHFYKCNTVLFRTIRAAFEEQFGSFKTNDLFFDFFKGFGCYVDHLCSTPIDKSNRELRLLQRKQCVASLAKRLKTYQPKVMVIIMKEIEAEVKQAIQVANINSIHTIKIAPFPSMSEGNRLSCINVIKEVLKNSFNSNN